MRRGLFAPGDQFRFTGNDWDFGASAGLLWQPWTKHSFGLSYRSETTMNFEGESRVVWYEGNYEDYEADRKKRLGAAAEQPHRIRYKPLTRR